MSNAHFKVVCIDDSPHILSRNNARDNGIKKGDIYTVINAYSNDMGNYYLLEEVNTKTGWRQSRFAPIEEIRDDIREEIIEKFKSVDERADTILKPEKIKL